MRNRASGNLEIPGSRFACPGMTTNYYTPGLGNPAIAQAARRVLTSRHATVI